MSNAIERFASAIQIADRFGYRLDVHPKSGTFQIAVPHNLVAEGQRIALSDLRLELYHAGFLIAEGEEDVFEI